MLSKVLLLSLSIKPRLTHIKTLIQRSISLKVYLWVSGSWFLESAAAPMLHERTIPKYALLHDKIP